ncbi:uncharacterized protein JCM6883_002759 [Sporobolomyces salmoneus]|uniref:uncharacterized protein n=1 Tax=Sporobolomyces salmoneus TaxID=183962 RepID=UPI00316BCF47
MQENGAEADSGDHARPESRPSLPFPSSPTSPSASTGVSPVVRSRPPALRSPRTSLEITSHRLSIASTSSSTSTRSQRPPLLLRSRHASLPASVVQSRHQSIVGTPGAASHGSNGMGNGTRNRISVASVGSFGSVEEEEEEDANGAEKVRSEEDGTKDEVIQKSASGTGLIRNRSRHSLPPPGRLPSFTSVLNHESSVDGRARDRSSSPLRPKKLSEYTEEERRKREEKRLRIAEELRDTENAYVQVLEEIDANYYQPLLNALPPTDPLSRRASNRYSSTVTSPNISPRSSSYDPSPPPAARSRTSTSDTFLSSSSTTPSTPPTPPSSNPTMTTNEPILSRREINEVFSNFTDVLNLSHVMLLTLNEAVPERPSEPLSISTTLDLSSSSTTTGSVELGLSSSGGTIESSGPSTPHESQAVSVPLEPTVTPRHSSRRPPAPPLRLGKTLLPIVPFLKQYSLFVANFSGSLSRLSQLERRQDPTALSTSAESASSRWKEFVKTRRVSSQGGKIGLGGMLLNIVQRVPRYRLLLIELLEFTERDHPDLRDLQMAFNLVDSVATHLDSQIESHTHDLAILDLQRCFSSLEFPLLSPGRQLVKHGSLQKFNRSGKEQTRTFFLFNDILLHAVSVEQWGLGISGVLNGGEESAASSTTMEQTYKMVDRFELEDVTVVGSEEGQRKYGFEVLTTRKSFAVYADSLETKLSWLDAVRDAKAALMNDRRTLQRATIYDSVAPSSDASLSSKTERRVSLPSPSKDRSSFLATPPRLARQVSNIPQLGTIPPTPGDELQTLEFPIATSPLRTESPQESPPIPLPSSISPSPTQSPSSNGSPPVGRPSLARVRRWSEMRPSDAVQAITSAFIPSSSATPDVEEDQLSSDRIEYKVIEAYHAPVWVPDSKADKCMRCGDSFGLWRRKHHCRLCGGVVCWKCSTKYFIIPGYLLSSSSSSSSSPSPSYPKVSTPSQEDRLARSCDTCFTNIFEDPLPSSRFLGASTPGTTFGRKTLQPCVDRTATLNRLSRIIHPREMPLFDLVEGGGGGQGTTEENSTSPEPERRVTPRENQDGSETMGVQKRRRRLTAMGQLQTLLAKQS